MPNHWHLVVRPNVEGEISRFGQWVCLTHTQRYHAHYRMVGLGHLYQGLYKSFPVQADEHFLILCRYVERNAFAANLCSEPDQWRHGSLYRWRHGIGFVDGHSPTRLRLVGAIEKLLSNRVPTGTKPGWEFGDGDTVGARGSSVCRHVLPSLLDVGQFD